MSVVEKLEELGVFQKGKIKRTVRRTCYECEWFDDNPESLTHLKCLWYQTYVYTPKKAKRCTRRLHFLGEMERE